MLDFFKQVINFIKPDYFHFRNIDSRQLVSEMNIKGLDYRITKLNNELNEYKTATQLLVAELGYHFNEDGSITK